MTKAPAQTVITEPANCGLASYACQESNSRGRRYPETGSRLRSAYQRDRDRIVHSAAFRRLEYKTQVFVNHAGDLFRTRLTHTLEVSQIARTVARSLCLNEDLVEAISLAHDLGHPPFGHAGQEALNHCMAEYGGFEHNLQSLRIVDLLEERYAEFDGLNLCYETREGILKHCSPKDATMMGDVGRRFLVREQPSLEAQLANIADEMAYVCHDIDDGLRAGLIDLPSLSDIVLFSQAYGEVKEKYPDLNDRRSTHESVRRMLSALITDVVDATRQCLAALDPDHPDVVRSQDGPLVRYSSNVEIEVKKLKSFLLWKVYRHHWIKRMSVKAQTTIETLFKGFIEQPDLLPPTELEKVRSEEKNRGPAGRARVIADYIAGMTDRYAALEKRRLVNSQARV